MAMVVHKLLTLDLTSVLMIKVTEGSYDWLIMDDKRTNTEGENADCCMLIVLTLKMVARLHEQAS